MLRWLIRLGIFYRRFEGIVRLAFLGSSFASMSARLSRKSYFSFAQHWNGMFAMFVPLLLGK